MRAAIYTRLSKDRPDETSRERQEADCRALCEIRGYEVVSVYTDLLSGYRRGVHRPGYEALVGALRSGAIHVGVVWKLDRLTRQGIRDIAPLLDALERGGSSLVSVQDSVDTSTAMGEGVLGLMASMAKQESENISLRTRNAKAHFAATGAANAGGLRPFGYESDRVTVNKAEARLIRDAAARVLRGETLYAVATAWNADGITTPTGKTWQPNQLRRVLESSRVWGKREHRGLVVADAEWEAILDPDTARQLAGLFSSRLPSHGWPRTYLLTGFLFCGLCDTRLIARQRDDGKKSYMCLHAPGMLGCGRLRVVGAALEKDVELRIGDRLHSPAFASALERRSDDVDIKELLADIARHEGILDELTSDYYEQRVIQRRQFLAMKAAVDRNLATARHELSRAQSASVMPDVPDLFAHWPSLSLDGKRAVLKALIDRIVVSPASARGARYSPRRTQVVWWS